MEITNSKTFETQSGGIIGQQHNIKHKSKNILVKLEDVLISPLEKNKISIRLESKESLDTMIQLENKLNDYIVTQFDTTNDHISPIIYASKAENFTLYTRLNNYTMIYDGEGKEYKLNNNNRYVADVILKYDTITYINDMFYVNVSLYQCLIKEELSMYSKNKILLTDEVFINNF